MTPNIFTNMEMFIYIIIGLCLIFVGIALRLKTKKIEKDGVEAEGIVFSTTKSEGLDTNVTYPVIRFLTASDEWITETYTNSIIPGILTKGKKVIVVYDPANPKEFIVRSKVTSALPAFVIALGLIILSFGIYKLLHIQL